MDNGGYFPEQHTSFIVFKKDLSHTVIMWLWNGPGRHQTRASCCAVPIVRCRHSAQPLAAEGWPGRWMGRWKMMWSLLWSQQAPKIWKHDISLPRLPDDYYLMTMDGFVLAECPLASPIPLCEAQCLPPRFCISTAGPSIKCMVCLCLEGTGDLPSSQKSLGSCCFILCWGKHNREKRASIWILADKQQRTEG